MIPKIIHYIWLGGKPLPKIAQRCIASWKKYCPDYEIRRWDESNLDLTKYKFCKDAYDQKKFAFSSDVLRTDILYEFGGIYLDIDVELLKPLDNLLNFDSFGGFENSNLVNPGLLWGTIPYNDDLKKILEIYKNSEFDPINSKNLTVCEFYTGYYEKLGLVRKNETQKINNSIFYSSEYFSPINVITNKKKITKKTYSIHWFNASWYSPAQKLKNRVKKILNFCTFGLFGRIINEVKHR